MTSVPHLFRPLILRGIQTRNRVVISPMCQYSAHEGHLDDWHLVHLGRFATGGAGIVFTEATAVQKSGRITHGCPGLWADSQIQGHARVARFALQNGAIPGIQLGHAGAKSGMQRPWFGNGPLGDDDFARGDMAWTPVSPSGQPVADGWPVPHALSIDEIGALIADYVSAAGREVMFIEAMRDKDTDTLHINAIVKPAELITAWRPNKTNLDWLIHKFKFDQKAIGSAKSVRRAIGPYSQPMRYIISCEHATHPRSGVFGFNPLTSKNFPMKIIDISGPKGVKFDRIELIDLDGDGDLDVLTCEERDNLGVIWYENPAN